MPLPPETVQSEALAPPVVPLGTRVHLSLQQFAESFKDFTFSIQFCTPTRIETRCCRVTGEVTEEGLEVIVVE